VERQAHFIGLRRVAFGVLGDTVELPLEGCEHPFGSATLRGEAQETDRAAGGGRFAKEPVHRG
jgi:hypothetical protein